MVFYYKTFCFGPNKCSVSRTLGGNSFKLGRNVSLWMNWSDFGHSQGHFDLRIKAIYQGISLDLAQLFT